MKIDRNVRAWIEYADHDLFTASHMAKTTPPPLEIIAYHLQQAAEKYLKAGLAAFEIAIPKTHDLLRLNRLFSASLPEVSGLEIECERLSDFGTVTRYPIESVILDEIKIKQAENSSHKICNVIRAALLKDETI